MLVPCGYTALTTVVAFASPMVAGIQPVIDFADDDRRHLCRLCHNFLFLPAMMAALPAPASAAGGTPEAGMTVRFAGWVQRYGTGVLLVTAVLLIAAVLGVSRLKVENRFIDYFKESTEIYQGMELLDARLGGTIPLDVILYPPYREAGPDDSGAPLVDQGSQTLGTAETRPAAGEFFDEDPMADDPFGDDLLSDDPFAGGDMFATDDSAAPSFWFTPQGRRLLDKAHARIEARPEVGKVLSLSTAFEVMDGLYGQPLGAVELALVEQSMPEDVDRTLVRPYFYPEGDEARISVRAKETSRELERDRFLRELHAELVAELDVAPERIQFTSLLVLYNNVLQSLFRSQILTLGAVFLAIGLMFWSFPSPSLALALAPNAGRGPGVGGHGVTVSPIS